MKLFLAGVTSCRNRGVDALVRSILDETLKRKPGASFTILSETPDFDAVALADYPAEFLKMNRVPEGAFPKRLARMAQNYLTRGDAPLQKALERSDLCLATGGDVFTSDYGSLQSHLKPLEWAARLGVPFGFIGQTIGPFKNGRDTQEWLNTARKASFICVRETISRGYVAGLLDRPSDPPVTYAADSAFLLQPSGEGEALARLAGMDPSRPRVALAISRSISNILGKSSRDHFEAWKRTIDALLRETDWQLLLIPHVQGVSPKGNDLIMQTDLMRSLQWPERVVCASANLNSAEYKALLAQCDLVVAERMHAGVGALSSSVPTVYISYSVKFRGILLDFFPEELVDDTLLISLEGFLKDPQSSWGRIRNAFAKRSELSQILKAKLPAVKARAALNFKFLEK